MTDSEFSPRLLNVFEGKSQMPPPIWLMRQAGRYLPEYRKVREMAGSFWSMCMTPELSVEVTLQPVRRFDFDAAIIFSDILVIPFALGMNVRFEDGIGPIIEPLQSVSALERDALVWNERLAPVYAALKMVRAELPKSKALIGFAGAPWTLAAYMVEGRGTKDQGDARLYAYRNEQKFEELLNVLGNAVASHLIGQFEAGADVVQIFDSWAGGLPQEVFEKCVIDPTKRIVDRVREMVPNASIIGFPRQATQLGLEKYVLATGVDAIGIDTATSIGWAAETFGRRHVVQGNLDPMALIAGGEVLDRSIDVILKATSGTPFIFNLGHGILPSTPIDNVAHLIARIRRHEGVVS